MKSFPNNFLPMILTSDPDMVMSGKITFSPVIEKEKAEHIAENLLQKYPGRDILEDGYVLNLADLEALALSTIPLVYEDSGFILPDQRIRNLGNTAVIIVNPQEFVARVQYMIQTCYPNIRFMEIANVQYLDQSDPTFHDPEKWKLYTAPMTESWKKELLFTARILPKYAIGDLKHIGERTFQIGDMSNIAIAVSTHELTEHIPEELKAITSYMDFYETPMKGITRWSFSAMGNIMSIEPTKQWIDLFGSYLDRSWTANTVLEKMYEDGASMPRLAFYHGDERIYFGINSIRFQFHDWNDGIRQTVRRILTEAGKLTPGFCRMSVSTDADLGPATEEIATKNIRVQEGREHVHNGLIISENLESDYRIGINILGRDRAQIAWRYSIKTSLPEIENKMWYSDQDVFDYFEEAERYNESKIEELMKGDPYARYREM